MMNLLGSSVEGDDSETDPDYNPAKEVDDEDTPSKAKKPKTTNEGNNTHFCSWILFKYSELLPSIILHCFRILSKYWVSCIFTHLV